MIKREISFGFMYEREMSEGRDFHWEDEAVLEEEQCR